jgi:hypothetical protein
MKGPRRILEVAFRIGPVFSHAGLKNWHLHLCADEIVGVPLGLWLSIIAGILAGIGAGPEGAYAQHPENDDTSRLVDSGHPGWRRYRLSVIEFVMVKRSTTANEIRIKAAGSAPHVYGIGDRSYTDRCRSALGQLYGNQYREDGFEPFWKRR